MLIRNPAVVVALRSSDDLLQAVVGSSIVPGHPVIITMPLTVAFPLVAIPVSAPMPSPALAASQMAISYGEHASIVNSGGASYVHTQQPAPQSPMTAGVPNIAANMAAGAIVGGIGGGGVVN